MKNIFSTRETFVHASRVFFCLSSTSKKIKIIKDLCKLKGTYLFAPCLLGYMENNFFHKDKSD